MGAHQHAQSLLSVNSLVRGSADQSYTGGAADDDGRAGAGARHDGSHVFGVCREIVRGGAPSGRVEAEHLGLQDVHPQQGAAPSIPDGALRVTPDAGLLSTTRTAIAVESGCSLGDAMGRK